MVMLSLEVSPRTECPCPHHCGLEQLLWSNCALWIAKQQKEHRNTALSPVCAMQVIIFLYHVKVFRYLANVFKTFGRWQYEVYSSVFQSLKCNLAFCCLWVGSALAFLMRRLVFKINNLWQIDSSIAYQTYAKHGKQQLKACTDIY